MARSTPCNCKVCRDNWTPGTIRDMNTGQPPVTLNITTTDIQSVIDAMTNLTVAASSASVTFASMGSGTTTTATITGSGGSGGSGGWSTRMPPDVEEYWTHETITGWRNWRLAGHGLTALLGMNNVFWRKPTVVATHRGSSAVPHEAPAWGCNCGINAVKGLDILVASNGLATQHTHTIYGTVAMSGIVHEYELGYRAQKATVSELFLIARAFNGFHWERVAETLRQHYRCPVRLVELDPNERTTDRDVVQEHIRQLESQGATR